MGMTLKQTLTPFKSAFIARLVRAIHLASAWTTGTSPVVTVAEILNGRPTRRASLDEKDQMNDPIA